MTDHEPQRRVPARSKRSSEVTLFELVQYTAHQIEREDALINNRLTWVLAFQGFLFLSVATVLTKSGLSPAIQRSFVTAASLAGGLVCLMAVQGVKGALSSIDRIKGCWREIVEEYSEDVALLAQPYGEDPDHQKARWLALGIPYSVILGWVGVFIAAWVVE